jgi:hypothetical protein
MNDWEKHYNSINKNKAEKIIHVGGVRGIPKDLNEILGAVRIDPKKFFKKK